MTDIRNFIEENSINFYPGSRNSAVVILIGYAQHLGLSKTQLEKELEDEIAKDDFIQEEIDRLWNYCASNNYKKFWKTEDAKMQYTF